MTMFRRSPSAHEFPEGAEWLNVDRPLRMEDLRGRVVLLDFWTFCCINCMHVIPDLKRLERKYPHLVVVGVHSAKFHNEQVKDNIRHAILRYEVEHPVVVDNDFVLWRAYGIQAWPSFVLIDPAGNVAGTASGEGPYSMFDDAIASLSAAFDEQGALVKGAFPMDLVKDGAHGTALSYPGKIDVHWEGKRLFVSDSNHNRIVVLSTDGNLMEVIGSGEPGRADGDFANATFLRPQGVVHHPVDGSLYVADTENHLIRRVDLGSERVETVLGTGRQGNRSSGGQGTGVAINSPWDLTIMGDHLYIAMAGPHQIWRMHLGTRKAEVYAGSGREDIVDGPRLRAALAQPSGIDNDGRYIFFADSEVSAVRMVINDEVRTLVGAGLFDFGDVDGPFRQARLQHPLGVRVYEDKVYVADTYNHKIKVIDPEAGTVSTLIGTGQSGNEDSEALLSELSEPNDVDFFGYHMFIVDTNNHRIRSYDYGDELVHTLEIHDPHDRLFPQRPEGLRGKEVVLAPVAVAPGKGRVNLMLWPPEDHRWNDDAPDHVEVVAEGDGVTIVGRPEHDYEFPDLSVPIDIDARGSANVRVRAVLYYCEEYPSEFCRFAPLELVLPVQVMEGGGTDVEVEYQLIGP